MVQAIRYSFGFVSGNLLHDEMIRLEYPDESFNTVIGFELQKLRDSVHSIAPMKPDLLREYRKHLGLSHLHSETHFPESTFEKLVQMCLSDPQLLRACKLMAESGDHTLEIKASIYSVALETLKNIILVKNEEKINPFKSRKKASKIMASLKGIIEQEVESSFNNKKMILKKIEQLNQVGNRDGFLLAFKLLGIRLNEDDKRCINMRNDFLHGRIPYEDERQEYDPRLVHIVFKLHLLVSYLILKHCGYSGPVLNQIKLTDLYHFKNQLKEPLFRKI